MSITFDSALDFARIAPSAGVLLHTATTITARIRITSAAAGVALAVEMQSTHLHEITIDSAGTAFVLSRNYGAATGSVGTGTLNTWVPIALVLYESSGTKYLRAYINDSSTFVDVSNPQFVDSIINIWAGGHTSGGYPRGRIADVKIWSAALTASEIATEFAQQSAARSAGLAVANYFDGGNIGAAMSSDVSNYAWGDTWDNVGLYGASGTAPTYSTDAPTYSPIFPVLTGGFTMPAARPADPTAIAVTQTAQGSVLGTGASASATFNARPAIGSLLLVAQGGWLGDATGASIADNQPDGGLAWTQRLVRARTPGGQDVWIHAWTARVTRSAEPFAVTVTATGGTIAPWMTIGALEIVRADTGSPIDGTPVSATGTGTTATVDHANTTSALALAVGLAAWNSTEATPSAGGGYAGAVTKAQEAGLQIATRTLTSTGNYDPSWTFDISAPWVVGALVIKQQTAAAAAAVTTTSIPAIDIGAAVAEQIEASGSGPITIEVVSGTLPPWASLSASGLLTGVATGGAWTVSVAARNGLGLSASQSLTVTVGQVANITTTSLPSVVTARAFTLALLADGTGPLTWSLTDRGTLPTSVALVGNTLSGEVATAGTYTFTVGVVGSAGSDTQALSLVVVAASSLPVVTTTALPAGTVGTAYSTTLAATGAATITWAASGVPAGLSLNASTGVIAGTPTAAGLYIVTAQVANSVGQDVASLPLRVGPAAGAEVVSPWSKFLRR